MMGWLAFVSALVHISYWYFALAESNPDNVPDAEISALYDLYTSANGEYWRWHASGNIWNFADANPCEGSWQGVFCTDTPVEGSLHVYRLSLPLFNMNGTIPDSIGNLTYLNELSLPVNNLTSRIPPTLGQLLNLTWLDLGENLLTGVIPESLGQLQKLNGLNLHNNTLTGTIPNSLTQCHNLTGLALYYNDLTGSIPNNVGQLTRLQILYLDANRLTGRIPDSLGQCKLLIDLDLDNNLLSGPFPDSLGSLTHMVSFELYNNKLTGTLPSQMENWHNLTNLLLFNNKLHGSLPNIFNSKPLAVVNVQGNSFDGTLPAAVFNGSANSLETLLCNGNQFSGAIPEAAVGIRLKLIQLGLSANNLEGTVSQSVIAALSSVAFLFLDNNRLTGTIPQNWTAPAGTLSYLTLQANQLRGTIPGSLGHMALLQSLNLSNNHLTGTIPTTFRRLRQLQVLMLQSNSLRGSLQAVFDPELQRNLSTVQLSNNQLTGTLPEAVFRLPALRSFAAVENCFKGPLPEASICTSATLAALVLDGLHAAPACERGVSLSHKPFKLGTVPLCLLSMHRLATLHLSGAGLTGSLPADANISAVLTDLSLSDNLLTGRIPRGILDSNWDKLDLSYNRFIGTLHTARNAPYNNDTILHLEHNRLSGIIPRSIHHVGTLSLLENNMFSCRVDRSDLPSGDSQSKKYTCGSDSVNNALYVWSGILVLAGGGGCWLALRRRQLLTTMRTWMNAVSDSRLGKLHEVFKTTRTLSTLAVGCATYCALVLLPAYAVVNAYYPGFTLKYAWTVSGVFLFGTTAFAVEAAALLLQLPLCGYAAEQLLATTKLLRLGESFPSEEDLPRPARDKRFVSEAAQQQNGYWNAAVMFCCLTMVTGINVAFVFATLRMNGRALTIVQIVLAVSKLSYNNIVAPTLQNSAKLLGVRTEVGALQLILALMNVIVIPCLVVMAISPACYYDLLTGSARTITSSYEYSGSCLSFTVGTNPATGEQTLSCAGEQTETDTTSYSPPFTYSYQCSSSFITYYAPTFVIMCIISGFLVPVQRLLLVWLAARLPEGSRLHAWVIAATPRLLKVLQSRESLVRSRSDPLHRPAFNASQLVMTLLTYLALLLTFGALFPPLALCCAAAMVSVALTARLEVGRYVTTAIAAGREDCLRELESGCIGAGNRSQILKAVHLILVVACMFYTLFLFDTLGDEVGFAAAFWVLVVVPVLPVVVWGLCTQSARCAEPPTSKEAAIESASHDPQGGVALSEWSHQEDTRITGANDNPMHSV